jgi:hypothetical protein
MNPARLPAILPPAITVSREVAEMCMSDYLAAYGPSGPAALAWQWALTGQGPTPVSLREWQAGFVTLPGRRGTLRLWGGVPRWCPSSGHAAPA